MATTPALTDKPCVDAETAKAINYIEKCRADGLWGFQTGQPLGEPTPIETVLAQLRTMGLFCKDDTA